MTNIINESLSAINSLYNQGKAVVKGSEIVVQSGSTSAREFAKVLYTTREMISRIDIAEHGVAAKKAIYSLMSQYATLNENGTFSGFFAQTSLVDYVGNNSIKKMVDDLHLVYAELTDTAIEKAQLKKLEKELYQLKDMMKDLSKEKSRDLWANAVFQNRFNVLLTKAIEVATKWINIHNRDERDDKFYNELRNYVREVGDLYNKARGEYGVNNDGELGLELSTQGLKTNTLYNEQGTLQNKWRAQYNAFSRIARSVVDQEGTAQLLANHSAYVSKYLETPIPGHDATQEEFKEYQEITTAYRDSNVDAQLQILVDTRPDESSSEFKSFSIHNNKLKLEVARQLMKGKKPVAVPQKGSSSAPKKAEAPANVAFVAPPAGGPPPPPPPPPASGKKPSIVVTPSLYLTAQASVALLEELRNEVKSHLDKISETEMLIPHLNGQLEESRKELEETSAKLAKIKASDGAVKISVKGKQVQQKLTQSQLDQLEETTENRVEETRRDIAVLEQAVKEAKERLGNLTKEFSTAFFDRISQGVEAYNERIAQVGKKQYATLTVDELKKQTIQQRKTVIAELAKNISNQLKSKKGSEGLLSDAESKNFINDLEAKINQQRASASKYAGALGLYKETRKPKAGGNQNAEEDLALQVILRQPGANLDNIEF